MNACDKVYNNCRVDNNEIVEFDSISPVKLDADLSTPKHNQTFGNADQNISGVLSNKNLSSLEVGEIEDPKTPQIENNTDNNQDEQNDQICNQNDENNYMNKTQQSDNDTFVK